MVANSELQSSKRTIRNMLNPCIICSCTVCSCTVYTFVATKLSKCSHSCRLPLKITIFLSEWSRKCAYIFYLTLAGDCHACNHNTTTDTNTSHPLNFTASSSSTAPKNQISASFRSKCDFRSIRARYHRISRVALVDFYAKYGGWNSLNRMS